MLEAAPLNVKPFGLNVTRIEVRFLSIVTTGTPVSTWRHLDRLLLTVAATVERVRARQRGRDGCVRVLVAVRVASHLVVRV